MGVGEGGGLPAADFFDPVADDPAADPRRPARTPVVALPSGGVNLPGLLHVPAGAGPHPVVVLLHGFPGYERNLDLAQVLRRAGYAALVFHYRGAWGTGGAWSIAHMLEDAACVLAAIRQPPVAAAYRLDARRVAVLGSSMGGFAALMTAAADPAIAAVISVATLDVGAAADVCRADPAARAAYVKALDGQLLPTYEDRAGGQMLPVRHASGESLVAEAEAAGQAWRLTSLGPQLAARPVLLIAGSHDAGAPPAVHHQPLAAAYHAAGARVEDHLFADRHDLPGHRVALARAVLGFLARWLPAPGNQITAPEGACDGSIRA